MFGNYPFGGSTWDGGQMRAVVGGGPAPITADLSVTLEDATCSAAAVAAVQASGSAALDGSTVSSAGAVRSQAAVNVTLEDSTCSAAAVVKGGATASVTLGDSILVSTAGLYVPPPPEVEQRHRMRWGKYLHDERRIARERAYSRQLLKKVRIRI